jgi:uncharacterized protein YvpB
MQRRGRRLLVGLGTAVVALSAPHGAHARDGLPSVLSIRAPIVTQSHPLDCEAASLQMALAARGTALDQETILARLPKDPRAAVLDGVRDVGGRPVARVRRWGDPFRAFVGDPDGSERLATGYGVYWPPIADVARAAGHRVVAGTDIPPERLYAHLARGEPAIVWLPWNLVRLPTWRWRAWDGTRIVWNHAEHTMVLVGLDLVHDTVTLDDPDAPADPATGAGPYVGAQRTVSREEFEERYGDFHRMAVIVR